MEDYPNFGLEFDPSHLIWLMLDPYQFAQEFQEYILILHGKDTYINREKLADEGILGDWWESKMPGYGEIDWKRLLSIISEKKHNIPLYIELEDKTLQNAQSNNKKLDAILQTRKYLQSQ
jgi:sugar phosphate isomerase/epimerase